MSTHGSHRSVGIVGMGWVGASVAMAILQSGVASELMVHDTRSELAEGEAMDLAHGASFYPTARVRCVELDDVISADAVVIAAGRGTRPGEPRLALVRDNAALVRSIASRLVTLRGILIVLTNPVDIMTQIATESSGLSPARAIGTGTMLDTARLRQVLGREFDLGPRSIHAQVVGEHGDSEVVLWSGARIGGVPLRRWRGWDAERENAIATEVRRASYEIIRRKGGTNHAIGLVTAALLRACLCGGRHVLTVTRVQDGALGLRNVALSLPSIVSADGAVEVLEPDMDRAEREALMRSSELLRDAAAPFR